MAVSTIMKTQLRLVLQTGVDPKTMEPKLTRKSYGNIKANASATQLYSVAQSLASLQEHPLHGVERVDQSAIDEE